MKTNDIERRYFDAEELRFEQGETGPRVSGYAAVFNSPSEDLGGFREIIAPGAFRSVLGAGNVKLKVEHGGLPLADTRTGTLKLTEDHRGLAFSADLDVTDPDAQRVIPKLQRGTLRSMSFGFKVKDQRWDRSTGERTRHILEVRSLLEVSLVSDPAYPDTSVALRSLESWNEEQKAEIPAAPIQRELRRRRLKLAGL